MKKHAASLNTLSPCDQAQETRLIAQRIWALGQARGRLSILEAGCGNSWPLDLADVSYELTGVDMNRDALDLRKHVRRDLKHAVLGDLHTVELPAGTFDVIYNSFVLEHVAGAELVLENFQRWLRPGGLLILRIPDPQSVYGFLARLTPFWFHVFYKRYVAGVKTAGKPGYDPFPTVYDGIVSRTGIHDWCAANHLSLEHEVAWTYPICRPGLLSIAVHGLMRGVSGLSLGRLAHDHINLTYVIGKPCDARAPEMPTVSRTLTQVR